MHPLIDSALFSLDMTIERSGLGNALMPFFGGPLAGLARRRKRYVARQVLRTLALRRQVSAGPFAGMRYANLEAKCSAILPKLFGTYERELASILERLLRGRTYNVCIDIGSAEGYYAVGVALLQPQCKVYAVDNDPSALELCKQNAIANDCAERVALMNAITASELSDFLLKSPSLIISDCEGYEKELFNASSVRNLSGCDVIIEVHSFVDPAIEEHLQTLFALTHDLNVVKSLDDRDKAHVYDVPAIMKFDIATRTHLLSEFRPCPMEWFVFTPKISMECGY